MRCFWGILNEAAAFDILTRLNIKALCKLEP
jgi:hypothetical protein